MVWLANFLVAIGLIWLGMYICSWGIAKIIIESSEAELLAKVREIKREAEDKANDYRNA